MRRRHTDMAVSTCSGSSSASELTGSGAFTTTSCEPCAGRLANRSGSPRPPASGSVPAAATPSSGSAGYRFGTTRTRQLPSSRSAYSSGGVRSSWPAANGSVSGSIGGRGAMSRKAPGREPRSPATITRTPVSGSIRRSGKPLLHRHVLDALLHERRAVLAIAGGRVQRQSVRLRVQRDRLGAGAGRNPVGFAEDRRAHAVAAPLARNRQPAEPGHVPAKEQPAGADHLAPVVDGHDVGRLGVASVLVGLERHALLLAEDARAQRERLGHLVLRQFLADLHGQRA